MIDPDALLAAARRILAGAARDAERGLDHSACVSAQRAAVMATEAWLRSSGQPHVSGSVRENVGLSPASGPEVRRAATLLDRHRLEEGYPHRSGETTAGAGESEAVVDAGRTVLAFVEAELGAG